MVQPPCDTNPQVLRVIVVNGPVHRCQATHILILKETLTRDPVIKYIVKLEPCLSQPYIIVSEMSAITSIVLSDMLLFQEQWPNGRHCGTKQGNEQQNRLSIWSYHNCT